MRRVIFNQKGGVGKSTITCNLAAIAAHRGLRTLVIDLDAQANATHYLLGESVEPAADTVAGYFEDTLSFRIYPRDITEIARPTRYENLAIVAAHCELETLHGRLESRYKIYKLRESLAALDDFDRVYIDTPPALNFYTRSALIAANRCLVPFDCDAFARSALDELIGAVEELRMDHNPDLEIEGIVVNQFQSRARLPRELTEELRARGNPLAEPFLPASVKVRESHQAARPLIDMAPRHKLTQAFVALHDALEAV